MSNPRFALLLCLCLTANAVFASKQDDLDRLRQRISTLQQQLEKTTESRSEATDALRESESAISDSKRRLAELSHQQRETTQTLRTLQLQGQQLEQDIQEQQALLGKLLYQQYLGGRQEYLLLLLNNQDPNLLERELQYFEYIARGRATLLESLRTNQTALRDVTDQTSRKSKELSAMQDEERSQKQALEKDQNTRRQVLARVALQLRQQRREIGKLQQDEGRLAKLVEELSSMLDNSGGLPGTSGKLPDDRFDGDPFDTLKGKLSLPVKGVVSNHYDETRPDSTVLWKGLFLRAAESQPVKAIAAGRVVFADWLRGFGNLLIVDHGKGYMSLYGNNEALYKQVGDELHGGDTIAAVGNTGGNEHYGLYFELRHEGKTLDPMEWVAH